ncbi:MAG TPA: HEAT repeat domain-containing protein [Gemmataceae bacterium]|nr:HEAT repeat domain-containing protein [Gemmataceae bacterium]
MYYRRLFLVLGCIAGLAAPASAGFILGKQSKPSPAERVPQLLMILRTDGEENKRSNAAKELGEFDPKAFPEMIPTLIQTLKQDPKASVRVEIVQTLGKLRPISQEAGRAIESALEDASWRVRWQARQTLWGYRLSGYRSPPKPEAVTHSPPPAVKQGMSAAAAKHGLFSTSPKSGQTLVPNETPPPPLADPAPAPLPLPPPPNGVSTPAPAPSDAGPDLPTKH